MNLIIQTAFLGDLLLSIPLIKKMRQLDTNRSIGLVCRKGLGDILLQLKLVDHVFEIKKGDPQSYIEALKKIETFEIQTLLCPHQSIRTAFFVRKMRAVQKIGFSKWWNFNFFDRRISFNKKLPDAIRQLSLLKELDPALATSVDGYLLTGTPYRLDPAGKVDLVPQWGSMSVDFSSFRPMISRIKEKFSWHSQKKVILLFPGSVWATKQWSESGFIQLGKLLNPEYQIMVMGGPDEVTLCERVASQIEGAISLSGKTSIIESLLLIYSSNLVISNDSASAHLAAIAATPSIAIFGPTVVEFGYRPWQNNAWIVQNANLKCRPCGSHGHMQCPLKTHECMKSVPAEQVHRLAQTILRNQNSL